MNSSAETRARGGFALIAVLWLVAALGVVVTAGLASVETARLTAENRIHAARARWAALGCLAMAQSRYSGTGRLLALDSVALGASVWCGLHEVDPAERVNPNVADSVGLTRVLDQAQVAALLDWMDADDAPRAAGAEAPWYRAHHRRRPRNAPFQAVAEMTLVRGFETADISSLEGWFTVRGDGRVAPNRASERVLETIGILPQGSPATLVAMRASGRRYSDAADIVNALGLSLSTHEFRALAGRLSFDEGTTTFRVEGASDAGGRLLRTVFDADVRAAPGQLAVLRIELR